MNYRRFITVATAFWLFHSLGILLYALAPHVSGERMPWPDKTYSLLAALAFSWCWEGRRS